MKQLGACQLNSAAHGCHAGHTKEVIELAACAQQPALLLSLAKDGNVRLWDVPSEACLSTLQTEASSMVRGGQGWECGGCVGG